jgi:hypothetical protein
MIYVIELSTVYITVCKYSIRKDFLKFKVSMFSAYNYMFLSGSVRSPLIYVMELSGLKSTLLEIKLRIYCDMCFLKNFFNTT